jgi:hypothetical protein
VAVRQARAGSPDIFGAWRDRPRKAAEIAEHLGPAHARLHSLAIDHQRARAGMSYESAYAYLYGKPENLYGKPENEALRNAVKAEHMRATMSGLGGGELGKAAAPADPPDPIGSAHDEMADLVAAYMATHPKATREMAFTAVYTDVGNRGLKDQFDSEAAMRAHGVPPFAPYSAPGHAGEARNVGRSGKKPPNYAGG